MAHIDGVLIPVRHDRNEDYLAQARAAAPNFASTGERA